MAKCLYYSFHLEKTCNSNVQMNCSTLCRKYCAIDQIALKKSSCHDDIVETLTFERDQAFARTLEAQNQIKHLEHDIIILKASLVQSEEATATANWRCHEAAELAINTLGSIGPEDVGSAVRRLVSKYENAIREHAAAQSSLTVAQRAREELAREVDNVRLILDASVGETTDDAAIRLHNDWVDARERADRAERHRAADAISGRARLAAAERERDEARASAAAVERQMREARSSADANFVRANQMERERDEARALLDAADQRNTAARNALTAAGIPDVEPYQAEDVDAHEASLRTGGRVVSVSERIQRLARERVGELGAALGERARCVAWLRAVAEKSDEGSCVTESEWSGALRHAADRLDRGEHVSTPVPERATDEDLGRIVRDAWVTWAYEQPSPKPGWLVPWDEMPEGPDKDVDRRIGAAVAARVRREQCLVTRAVEAGLHLAIMPGMQTDFAQVARQSVGADVREEVVIALYRATRPVPADVPATLARLLGEVTRG